NIGSFVCARGWSHCGGQRFVHTFDGRGDFGDEQDSCVEASNSLWASRPFGSDGGQTSTASYPSVSDISRKRGWIATSHSEARWLLSGDGNRNARPVLARVSHVLYHQLDPTGPSGCNLRCITDSRPS